LSADPLGDPRHLDVIHARFGDGVNNRIDDRSEAANVGVVPPSPPERMPGDSTARGFAQGFGPSTTDIVHRRPSKHRLAFGRMPSRWQAREHLVGHLN
jgi:hypothetical protein